MPTSHYSILTGICIYHGNRLDGSNENCSISAAFSAADGHVLRKISKCHNFCFALRSIIRFALPSAVFEIFHIFDFSLAPMLKYQSAIIL